MISVPCQNEAAVITFIGVNSGNNISSNFYQQAAAFCPNYALSSNGAAQIENNTWTIRVPCYANFSKTLNFSVQATPKELYVRGAINFISNGYWQLCSDRETNFVTSDAVLVRGRSSAGGWMGMLVIALWAYLYC